MSDMQRLLWEELDSDGEKQRIARPQDVMFNLMERMGKNREGATRVEQRMWMDGDCEEEFVLEGRTRGYEHGIREGRDQGWKEGYAHGLVIGEKMGEILSTVLKILYLDDREAKIQKSAEQVLELMERLEMEYSDEFCHRFEVILGRYRLLQRQTGLGECERDGRDQTW